MATIESLSLAFSEFGYELSDVVLGNCLDLTNSYNISDSREFVETYVAFSATHLNGVEPSAETLANFERKELSTMKNKPIAPRKHVTVNLTNFEQDAEMEDDDVMDSYIARTPKAKRIPARTLNTPDVTFSPNGIGADSPATASQTKDVPGKVVYTFGSSALVKNVNWSSTQRQTVKIAQIPQSTNKSTNKYGFDDHYMFDTLLAKCEIAADRIYDIAKDICAKLIKDRPEEFNEELYENLSHVDVPNQATIRCIGRICSDNDCALDLNSTHLAGADEMKLRTVSLQFSKMKAFALFPGQTVLVQGTNPRGVQFFVEEIFTETELKPSEPPKVNENLQFLIVAGPYTASDNLSYGPLQDIVVYCKQHKPDVLIMLGPFLDADHKCVVDGSMRKTFDDFFNDLLAGIMEAIGSETEVIIVSSQKDAHSSFVYPTYAYNSRQNYPNLHLLPDPCKITINGVSIGLSSTDILSHLQDNEIAVNSGDKIRRAFNYLLHQRSFYPLNPPPEDVSLDSELAKNYANLDFVPNLMILPSSMKCFIRDLNNCLVINPGQLTVYGGESTRGTFGRLVITPTNDYKSLSNSVACQIIKI